MRTAARWSDNDRYFGPFTWSYGTNYRHWALVLKSDDMKVRTVRTKDRLAAELRKVAESASPANAEKYEAFAKRAETGEFDDYADTYVCPITQFYTELMRAGFTKFAARVANGEFDATKEESDEWARSPSGQDAARRLPPEMRGLFGLKILN